MNLDNIKVMGSNVIMQQNELLWKKYSNIEILHLSQTLRIDAQCESPFVSFNQRLFVSAQPTDCFKVQISKIDNNSDYITLKDGVLYSKDMSRLIFCWKEKETLVVPQSVKAIDAFAFCLQTKLREIELHDGIDYIGNAAFMGCKVLERIVIPHHITEIKNDTFDGCVSLKKVELHNGVTSIGCHAFRHCDALAKIFLPQHLKVLDSFECCYSLQEIDIPATVEDIGGFMFCRNLQKVTLHRGSKKIKSYAFRYCDNLRKINFPDGLEVIGTRAFYPSKITRAVFPKSLKTIETEAFYHNKRLMFVKFLSNTDVKDCTFACCPIIRIKKPDNMVLGKKAFIQDTSLDKFAFWD